MDHTVRYSEQAKTLVENMPDFNKEAFEQWWWLQQREVGSNNVLEFLMQQKRLAKDAVKLKE